MSDGTPDCERAPSRLCARYGVGAGGFLPATIAITHPTNKFRRVMRYPRLMPKVSLHRGPFIVSSCETIRHSTNAMASFSRAPLNLTIALFIIVLSWVWRSCRSFFHGVRGGRARALIGREVQLPRTLLRPLGWSGSARSPYQAGLPTDPPIVLAVQHTRPHALLSPPLPSPPLPSPPLPSPPLHYCFWSCFLFYALT